jgi:hypothetical protein
MHGTSAEVIHERLRQYVEESFAVLVGGDSCNVFRHVTQLTVIRRIPSVPFQPHPEYSVINLHFSAVWRKIATLSEVLSAAPWRNACLAITPFDMYEYYTKSG